MHQTFAQDVCESYVELLGICTIDRLRFSFWGGGWHLQLIDCAIALHSEKVIRISSLSVISLLNLSYR